MRAKDNPFAVDRVLGVRYRPQGWMWEQLLRRLASLQYRAAIVGPEGRGKTTLLEDLGPRLARQGFGVRPLRLSREQPKFPRGGLARFFHDVRPNDLILLDGAEQMGRLEWWHFKRRARKAAGLVITSHRPGLLPTLVECRTDAGVLREIVDALLPGPSSSHLPPAQELFDRHRGNVREALRELYDRCADIDPSAG